MRGFHSIPYLPRGRIETIEFRGGSHGDGSVHLFWVILCVRPARVRAGCARRGKGQGRRWRGGDARAAGRGCSARQGAQGVQVTHTAQSTREREGAALDDSRAVVLLVRSAGAGGRATVAAAGQGAGRRSAGAEPSGLQGARRKEGGATQGLVGAGRRRVWW
jgi:hypothetical protein